MIFPERSLEFLGMTHLMVVWVWMMGGAEDLPERSLEFLGMTHLMVVWMRET